MNEASIGGCTLVAGRVGFGVRDEDDDDVAV